MEKINKAIDKDFNLYKCPKCGYQVEQKNKKGDECPNCMHSKPRRFSILEKCSQNKNSEE